MSDYYRGSPLDLGSVLSLVGGTTLTTSYVGGTAVRAQGTEAIEYLISATGKAGTAITTMEYQVQVSEDGTRWDPVASTLEATTAEEHNVTVTAGATTTKRIICVNHRSAKFTRLATKSTGASAAGDASSATAVLAP